MEIQNGTAKLNSPALLLDSMEFSRKHNFERKSVVQDYEYYTTVSIAKLIRAFAERGYELLEIYREC